MRIPTKRLSQRLDLGILRLDNLLLPLVDPACESGEENVPGRENEVHVVSGCVSRMSGQHPDSATAIQAVEIRFNGPP